MVQGEIAEQRVDRGEPVVAGRGAVAPVAFQVVQEGTDQGCVQIIDGQLAGREAGALGGERQQQPEGGAIGRDRVRARGALGDQPLGEVGLQRRREAGHQQTPAGSRSRLAARFSSSGTAVRYQ